MRLKNVVMARALHRGFGWLGVVMALAAGASSCSRLGGECRAVSETANAFIAESERLRPRPNATPEETVKAELATAARYVRLAADLAALKVESSELLPEVERYRALAEHSAQALRAVAAALEKNDFEAARTKRIELDAAARGESPLVERINVVCGSARRDASGS